jgi:hypothetical protein
VNTNPRKEYYFPPPNWTQAGSQSYSETFKFNHKCPKMNSKEAPQYAVALAQAALLRSKHRQDVACHVERRRLREEERQ